MPPAARALLAIAVLAATASAATVANAPAAVTVDGRSCRGLELGGLPGKFAYDAVLTAVEAGPLCSRGLIK